MQHSAEEAWIGWRQGEMPPKDIAKRAAEKAARSMMDRDLSISSVVIELEPVVARLGERVTRLANCARLTPMRSGSVD